MSSGKLLLPQKVHLNYIQIPQIDLLTKKETKNRDQRKVDIQRG